MGQLGGGSIGRQVPAGPPRGSAPAVYQVYLRRLIDIPDATSLPALYEFLDTPAELVQEPVLFGEVKYAGRQDFFVPGNMTVILRRLPPMSFPPSP